MILSDKNMKCSTEETALRKEPHSFAKDVIWFASTKKGPLENLTF